MTDEPNQTGSTRRRFIRNGALVAGGLTLGVTASGTAAAGVQTANGWYETEEIYYINHGIEEGVTERGENDIYLIGGDRVYQAQVVEFIPGEPGYSPHWNVNVVHSAPGVTVDDILGTPYASTRFPEALFDDVADILGAEDDGYVTIAKPGVVVNCPVVSEEAAESPGNEELPIQEDEWDETF